MRAGIRTMRGYFGIGLERASKPMNAGNLFRSAHGFGASFVFTLDAMFSAGQTKSDTSRTEGQIPYYSFESADQLMLPQGCDLVGVELVEDAVDLPSFRHPRCAAYVLGPERGMLSQPLLDRGHHVVRIPTSFCLNVATAGAIIMYDRVISLGGFGERPVVAGAKSAASPPHSFGGPVNRSGES